MRTLLVSALALTAMSAVALADAPRTPANTPRTPVTLTDTQLDTVTAGQNINVLNVGIGAACVLAGNCEQNTGNVFNQGQQPSG